MQKLIIAVLFCASCYGHEIDAEGSLAFSIGGSMRFTFSTTFIDSQWDGKSALTILYDADFTRFSVGTGTVDSFALSFGNPFWVQPLLNIYFDSKGALFQLNADKGPDGGNIAGLEWYFGVVNHAGYIDLGRSIAQGALTSMTFDGVDVPLAATSESATWLMSAVPLLFIGSRLRSRWKGSLTARSLNQPTFG